MITRLVNYFTYSKDSTDPEKAMQGKYFIVSTMIFFGMALLSVPYFFFVVPNEFKEHPEVVYANFFFIFLIIGLMFVYKRYGGRVVIVNIITVMGFGSNMGTYQSTGGIWSSDLIWGLIISSWVFLVANRWSGLFWMVLTLITFILFYYAELNHHKDFIADATKMTAAYPFTNYFLAGVFMLLIIWLYDSSKRRFVQELRDSKAEVDLQKKSLESQKEDILASIGYAKKIQEAVLPHEETISRSIPLAFMLYKPRDIVSGDFFWFHEIDRDNYILACADCTGHGVPGAFMTVIGSNILSQIVKENKVTNPAEILIQLDQRINETLKQDNSRFSEVQDGMDLALIKVDKANKSFVFTSAKRPAIFIRDQKMSEFKGSKLSIGGMRSGEKKFEEITMDFQQDDVIYLFTDGYIDQFGGKENKKFMIKRFRELLLSINKLGMPEQKRKLDEAITAWIGNNEQTDDIQVIGIRF